jgi:hypothetical protein
MMPLREDIRLLTTQRFGPATAQRFEDLEKKFDPDADPKGFLEACIALLGNVTGPSLARSILKPVIVKYGDNE